MLLGVWQGRGNLLSEALAIERAVPELRHAEQVSTGCGRLWATGTARIARSGQGTIGWLYSGRAAHQLALARGPQVLLDEEGIEATVGPLPQFPLYIHNKDDGSRLVVCSELAPLLRIVPGLTPNLRRLVSIIAWLPDVEPDGSAYVGVSRLRAGERLVANRDGIRSTVELPRVGGQYRTDDAVDLAHELRGHLEGAVCRAIGDAHRVAVFCGGGLDSSGVLAFAVARCRSADRRDLEALAEVWASPGDDRPHLRALEQALGIVAIRLGAREAAPWFSSSLLSDGQPQMFAAACTEMLLWETARARRAEVALSGHAGDVVSGDGLSLAGPALRGHIFKALSEALRMRVPPDASAVTRLGWVFRPLLRPLLPRALLMSRRKQAARRSWMTPHFLSILEGLLEKVSIREPRSPDEWLAHFCQHPVLAETCVSWGQVASETGFLAVDVFRDLELVRFMSEVEPTMRLHGHMSRGLYRLALEGLVPDSVRFRTDKALGSPLLAEAAVAAGARDLLQDLSSLRELAALGLANPEAFRHGFEAWLAVLMRGERAESDPTDRTWHEVWSPLVAEAFLRHHVARVGEPATGCVA